MHAYSSTQICQLDPSLLQALKSAYHSLQPPCPIANCQDPTHIAFHCFNNAPRSYKLQAVYDCHTCKRRFTLNGHLRDAPYAKRVGLHPSSKDEVDLVGHQLQREPTPKCNIASATDLTNTSSATSALTAHPTKKRKHAMSPMMHNSVNSGGASPNQQIPPVPHPVHSPTSTSMAPDHTDNLQAPRSYSEEADLEAWLAEFITIDDIEEMGDKVYKFMEAT